MVKDVPLLRFMYLVIIFSCQMKLLWAIQVFVVVSLVFWAQLIPFVCWCFLLGSLNRIFSNPLWTQKDVCPDECLRLYLVLCYSGTKKRYRTGWGWNGRSCQAERAHDQMTDLVKVKGCPYRPPFTARHCRTTDRLWRHRRTVSCV